MYKRSDILQIYLPLKLNQAYSYEVPPDLLLKDGDIVIVPFGSKEVYGIVYGKTTHIDFDKTKLKQITQKANDIVNLDANFMKFISWISSYTLNNFGSVLKMAINIAGQNFSSVEQILQLNADKLQDIKITAKRAEAIRILQEYTTLEKKDLSQKSKVSISIINKLIVANILSVTPKIKVSNLQSIIHYTPVKLNPNQKEIAKNMVAYFNTGGFNVAVLGGIPGSGKTEVYFEAVQNTLNKGEQILILLPEIGLSTQIMERFELRFGVKPYVWHSNISKKEKKDTWLASNNGNLKVIIGARSALFLPFKKLGLIIVDEEHDSSYKQEEGVIYNARDMAVMRSKICNIPIILASATPSLESIHNVNINKYKLFELQGRYNEKNLPNIEIIDLKKETLEKGKILSDKLLTEIQNTLNKGEQVLLFINKRGYSSCLYCKSCEEKLSCINCSTALTHHKEKSKIVCHYCGYTTNLPKKCPLCQAENLVEIGIGIEQVHEQIQEKFTQYNIAMLSSDTITSYKKTQEMVQKIHNGFYNILIGTQIISKGYHFPKLTLVAIVDADFIYSLDLKANEKTWQLLYQVAGRSGRAESSGKVIMQSYNSNSNLLKSLVNNNYNAFLLEESIMRKEIGFPPFGKLASLIISCPNKQTLTAFCTYLSSLKPSENLREQNSKGRSPRVESSKDRTRDGEVSILGPTPAPIHFLRGNHRVRYLVKTTPNINIQQIIKVWLSKVQLKKGLKLQIDIDPISFY